MTTDEGGSIVMEKQENGYNGSFSSLIYKVPTAESFEDEREEDRTFSAGEHPAETIVMIPPRKQKETASTKPPSIKSEEEDLNLETTMSPSHVEIVKMCEQFQKKLDKAIDEALASEGSEETSFADTDDDYIEPPANKNYVSLKKQLDRRIEQLDMAIGEALRTEVTGSIYGDAYDHTPYDGNEHSDFEKQVDEENHIDHNKTNSRELAKKASSPMGGADEEQIAVAVKRKISKEKREAILKDEAEANRRTTQKIRERRHALARTKGKEQSRTDTFQKRSTSSKEENAQQIISLLRATSEEDVADEQGICCGQWNGERETILKVQAAANRRIARKIRERRQNAARVKAEEQRKFSEKIHAKQIEVALLQATLEDDFAELEQDSCCRGWNHRQCFFLNIFPSFIKGKKHLLDN